MSIHRGKVIALYKTLLFMGREYPLGYSYFRDRCYQAFKRNSDEQDPQKILQLIARGEFVVKELTALYSLKKYRTLKKRYYKTDDELQREMQERLNKIAEQEETPSSSNT